MNLSTVFGHNVRHLREEQGLTQEELAKKAAINRSYLSGVESGRRKICLENIEKLANALNVPVDILFRTSPKNNLDER